MKEMLTLAFSQRRVTRRMMLAKSEAGDLAVARPQAGGFSSHHRTIQHFPGSVFRIGCVVNLMNLINS
jgi:hypothetical protein